MSIRWRSPSGHFTCEAIHFFNYFFYYIQIQLSIRCRSPSGHFSCETTFSLSIKKKKTQLWIWCRSPLGHFTSKTFFLAPGELGNKYTNNHGVLWEGFFWKLRSWTYLPGQMMKDSEVWAWERLLHNRTLMLNWKIPIN